jgi:hypothetical protein
MSVLRQTQEIDAKNMERVIKAVKEEVPDRGLFDVSAKGLLEAATYVKDFTGNIAGTIANLGKLVLGGDG